MTRYDLEIKVRHLYDLIRDLEDSTEGNEEIEWCLSGLQETAKTLMHIAEDYTTSSTQASWEGELC